MADQATGASKGLLHSLGGLVATLVAILHTRLELLATDLEEQREHFFIQLLLTLSALFCLGVGAVLVTALIVVAFWDSHRLLVLGVLAGVFLTAGAVAWGFAIHRVRTRPRAFASSLGELLKDREQLASRP